MTIAEETQFAKEELEALFSSVRWESAKYPDRLVRAMRGFSCVLSAREEGMENLHEDHPVPVPGIAADGLEQLLRPHPQDPERHADHQASSRAIRGPVRSPIDGNLTSSTAPLRIIAWLEAHPGYPPVGAFREPL